MFHAISTAVHRNSATPGKAARSASHGGTSRDFTELLADSVRPRVTGRAGAAAGSKTALPVFRDGTVAEGQKDGAAPANQAVAETGSARAIPNPFNAAGYNVVREQAKTGAAETDAAPRAAGGIEADTREPLQVLQDKLGELGIDTTGLTFTEETHQNLYPTGLTWENHWITVDFGQFQEHYDADWMMKNPQITAVEIQAAKNFDA